TEMQDEVIRPWVLSRPEWHRPSKSCFRSRPGQPDGESDFASDACDRLRYALNWSCIARIQARPDLAVGELLGFGSPQLASRQPGATGQPSELKEREAVNARLSCGMFGGESPPRRIMARSGQRTASTGRKPAGGKSATGKVAQK